MTSHLEMITTWQLSAGPLAAQRHPRMTIISGESQDGGCADGLFCHLQKLVGGDWNMTFMTFPSYWEQ